MMRDVSSLNDERIRTESAAPETEWQPLPPEHLPRPTYWPVVLALAIGFLVWGIVTTLAISVVGLVLFALALGGWIGELRYGEH